MMRILFVVTLGAFAISCGSNQESFSAGQKKAVQDSVLQMIEKIANDISNHGPAAWLRYFENSSGFFMASDGQLVFPNNDSATNFINNTLIKSIIKIELHWSNIRIDPLSFRLANIAANFHEDLTDASGKTVPDEGYFTAIAEETHQGWKLRNAH